MVKPFTIKHILLSTTLACLIAPASIMAEEAPKSSPLLQTMDQKAAYAIGVNFVQSLNAQGIELDKKSLAMGVTDSANGTLSLPQEEMKKAFDEFKAKMMKKQQAAQKEAQAHAAETKKVGDAFLAENKAKEGIVTLASGLQYKVITAGTGSIPKASDKVTTNYRGTLIDGTEFDSSYARNKPTTFPVNGVIKGWSEALQLMHVGSKWQLFVPADLAYGARAVGKHIKANSTLIFDIELLSIAEAEKK